MIKVQGGAVALLAVLLGGCTGAAYAAGEPAPVSYAEAGCVMSSPEAGGRADLCPAGVSFVTVCELPTVNPTPLNTDCSELPIYGGRVWCCVGGETSPSVQK